MPKQAVALAFLGSLFPVLSRLSTPQVIHSRYHCSRAPIPQQATYKTPELAWVSPAARKVSPSTLATWNIARVLSDGKMPGEFRHSNNPPGFPRFDDSDTRQRLFFWLKQQAAIWRSSTMMGVYALGMRGRWKSGVDGRTQG